jgi:ribosomal protein S18 acetylase RimI-like enzyme
VPESPRIEEARQVTPALVAGMARLIPQLSRSAPPPTPDELEEMVASPATVVFIAVRDVPSEAGTVPPDPEVVGTLTLVLFRIPTGLRALIEDVVVDTAASRQGIGEMLTDAALQRAHALGVATVDLTSRPSREAANRLYQRLGFALRETNVYRYTFAD